MVFAIVFRFCGAEGAVFQVGACAVPWVDRDGRRKTGDAEEEEEARPPETLGACNLIYVDVQRAVDRSVLVRRGSQAMV